jgi:precorrin-2 dehydrogenase/sirohydrochlorin ferrochelatase
MRYYPAFLDVNARQCLVVGGGTVGTRKVRTLLECGARVTVISAEFSPVLQDLAARGLVTLKSDPYRSRDLEGMFLVIGATDDESLNQRVSEDAARRNMLCNIADRPKACSFILPAIVKRGDLVIAVSTSGKSPAFARYLRQRLETEFGPEYARFLELMGAVRRKLLAAAHAPEAHKPLFEALIDRGLVELIREGDEKKIDSLLREILGPDFSLDALTP